MFDEKMICECPAEASGIRMLLRQDYRSDGAYSRAVCQEIRRIMGFEEDPYVKDGLRVFSDSIRVSGKDVNFIIRIEDAAGIVSMIMSFREKIPAGREPLAAHICNGTNANLFTTLVYDGVWPDLFYLEGVIPCRQVFTEASVREMFGLLCRDTAMSITAVGKLSRKWLPKEYRDLRERILRAFAEDGESPEEEEPACEEEYQSWLKDSAD